MNAVGPLGSAANRVMLQVALQGQGGSVTTEVSRRGQQLSRTGGTRMGDQPDARIPVMVTFASNQNRGARIEFLPTVRRSTPCSLPSSG